tara:strand:- start:147 stop:707 length:561 start_codon:yes stop_codon:yes gene_type:complete
MTLFKTQLCHFVGHCKQGNKCKFAHSINELKKNQVIPTPQKEKRIRKKNKNLTEKDIQKQMFESDSEDESVVVVEEVSTPIDPEFEAFVQKYEDTENQMKFLNAERETQGAMTFYQAESLCYEYRNKVRDGNAPQELLHLVSTIPFNPVERLWLHEHITDLRLYSKSTGKGDERHLVVSHTYENLN